MGNTTCYIKLDRNIEIAGREVYFENVGSVRCADPAITAKIKNLKLHTFGTGEKQKEARGDEKNKFEEKRCIISVLKIIELIEKACPNTSVESLGETEVLVEQVQADTHKGAAQWLKTFLVALIAFFGTAFTIMAYHNDIGIADVFSQLHRVVMGSEAEGVSILELAYSIGLSLGIILFFNHVGGRRLTKDPTPIEVEMRKYEKDVNNTLVETAEREGRTIDVE